MMKTKEEKGGGNKQTRALAEENDDEIDGKRPRILDANFFFKKKKF